MNTIKITWLFSLLFPMGAPESNPCPNGWVQATFVNLGCLLFNSTVSYTWEEAYKYCYENENATLVEFMTEEQMDFLWMEMNVLAEHESMHHWWSGASDLGREGEWIWMNSLYPVPDFAWSPAQPNGGIRENCMYLYPSYAGGEDNTCLAGYYPICQVKNV